MTREMTENTKQRILEAAAHEFASKGFDGARVDEIARSAGVNKALIYYYYKNKEELLTILFLETRDAVVALMKSGIMQNIDYTKPDEITRMISAFLDVLEERQDVIRVMLMETAKRAPINKLVFDILADIIALMFSIAEDQHVPVDSNKSRAMITEFLPVSCRFLTMSRITKYGWSGFPYPKKHYEHNFSSHFCRPISRSCLPTKENHKQKATSAWTVVFGAYI